MSYKHIFIMEFAAILASRNGGVVRPKEVLEYMKAQDLSWPTDYAVRQVFKAMKRAGMVQFNANHYIWVNDSYLHLAMIDAAKASDGVRS